MGWLLRKSYHSLRSHGVIFFLKVLANGIIALLYSFIFSPSAPSGHLPHQREAFVRCELEKRPLKSFSHTFAKLVQNAQIPGKAGKYIFISDIFGSPEGDLSILGGDADGRKIPADSHSIQKFT